MRMARIRYDLEMCYYHLMNRVAGEPGYFPFGDVEKEKLFRLAVDLSRFYALDLLSVVVMGRIRHSLPVQRASCRVRTPLVGPGRWPPVVRKRMAGRPSAERTRSFM